MRPRISWWLGLLLVGASLAACGDGDGDGDGDARATSEPVDPGQVHIHGLGVNPSDGSLFIATHTGLFRTAPGSQRAQRVGEGFQDTMGFTVVGPDHFLGSGHPDPADDLPPFLGLIESRDAGRTWTPLSLHGEVDFHVLEASGQRVYGYGSDFAAREPRFLTSDDGGRTWERRQAPEPLISLALAPGDPRQMIASGERAVHRSRDGGRTWQRADAPGPGMLAWTSEGTILVGLDGKVWHSRDAATGRWRPAATVDGPPAALDQTPEGDLLVAFHDGVVKRSTDAGRTWAVRSVP